MFHNRGYRGRRLAGAAAAVAGLLALTACSSSGLQGSSGNSGGATSDTIKVGYISPRTGAYAGFSDGDAWMLAKIRKELGDGVKAADGKTYKVEIIDKDSGSDPQKAGQLADELINQDKVDVLLATSTPETTNPVIAKCEAEGVPCITTIAPWQAVYFGGGFSDTKPMKWTNHFFFGLEGFADSDPYAWDQIDTNKKVGVLWPNDADGQAFRDPKNGYAPLVAKHGYTVVDPGAYEDGTKDFTSIITKFKQAGVDIIAGVPIPPDFVTFWTQAAQQGLKVKAATVGKALFFPATVPSIPNDLGQGLSFAAWWGPTFPFKSSITGQTAQQWVDEFKASPDTKGLTWNQATPLDYSLFEVLKAGVEKSSNPLDKANLQKAVRGLSMDTMSGHLDFSNGPVPGIATMQTVIAQWEKAGDGWQWVVVDNHNLSSVAVARKLESLN